MRRALLLAFLCVAPACRSAGTGHVDKQSLHSIPDPVGPRILCVVAHPDDEIAFAGVLYQTATALGGACDVAVITNGEGGFKYATLSEAIYGLELSDEQVGRAHLPAIRRRELAAGCSILGVRDLYFLDQVDHRYTLDAREVLETGLWDLELVERALQSILRAGGYDFLFTLVPSEGNARAPQGGGDPGPRSPRGARAGRAPDRAVHDDPRRFVPRSRGIPDHGGGGRALRLRPHAAPGARRPVALQDRGQLGHRRAQVPGNDAVAR